MKLPAAIITSFFFLNGIVSFAQPRYSPEVRAKTETQWMQDSLALTPVQGNKVNAINIFFNKEMDKAATGPNPALKTQKQQHLRRKKNADMKAVLDHEQYQQYLKWEKDQELIEKQREKNSKAPHRAL